MARRSKKTQRAHGGSRSPYPMVSSYRNPRPGVDSKIDLEAFGRFDNTSRSLQEYIPDAQINVRNDIKTRAALPYIPNPIDGDVVHIELYRETWCYYNGAWHCTVAPAEAHRDPDRKDLLIKCWAWGP